MIGRTFWVAVAGILSRSRIAPFSLSFVLYDVKQVQGFPCLPRHVSQLVFERLEASLRYPDTDSVGGSKWLIDACAVSNVTTLYS